MIMIVEIIFGIVLVGVLVVWGILRIRARRSYKDDSSWPHGKDLKGDGK
jgi:hypothetical protein